MTFESCAEQMMAAHEAGWRSAKHRGQWRSTLNTYAYPLLGNAHPEIGRAEALRRSMVDLIQHGPAENAHPAMWAPFVLVGEGGAVQHETALAPPPAIASPTRPKRRVA